MKNLLKTIAPLFILIMFCAADAQAQTCQSAPSGLIAWYRAENSAADERGANNGSLQNGATFASGKVGLGFSFDGTNDFVSIPNSPSLSGLTTQASFEAWINPQPGGASVQWIFGHRNPQINESFGVRFSSDGTFELILGTSQNGTVIYASPAGAIQFNQWQHIAVTVNTTTGTARAYLNGNAVTLDGGAFGGQLLSASENFIGARQTSDSFFNGLIDEASVYNSELSAAQVQTIFNAGSAGKCKPVATAAPSGNIAWLAGDGSANDSAGTNNGMLQAGAKFVVGKVGQAFSIGANSSDDNVRLNSNGIFRNLSDAAIEAWIFPRGSGSVGGNSIFFEDVGITPGTRFQMLRNTNGSIQIFGRDAAGTIINVSTPAGAAPLNAWTHVAGVYEAGVGAKIYINGTLSATLNNPALTNFSADNSARVRIGAAGNTDTVFGEFNGDIDEISFYNRALTEEEIVSVVNAGIAGKLKQNATIETNSLVSLWQGENNASDTRGANNGTFPANTFAPGKVGQAFNLDGVDDSVNLGAVQTMQTFSLEAWVNPSSAVNDPLNQELIVGQAGFGSQIVVRPGTSGGVRVVVQFRDTLSSFAQLSSTEDIPLNSWTHLAGTFDGATLKLYLNGVLNAQFNPVNTTLPVCTTPYFIGGFQPVTDCNNVTNPPFQFFNGLIDEAAVYNRALTAAEIRANYQSGNALSTVVGDARITFPNVTSAGTTQEIPLDPATLPALPAGAATGLFYDIATSAAFSGNPQVCFNLPSFTPAQFANLRISHLENNIWVNRTSTANVYPNLCSSGLTSLSPFAIVAGAPTAAGVSIDGRVLTEGKPARGIGGANLELINAAGETRVVRTNTFGYYRFADVPAGETYIVTVRAKRYRFEPDVQLVNAAQNLTDINFVAAEP